MLLNFFIDKKHAQWNLDKRPWSCISWNALSQMNGSYAKCNTELEWVKLLNFLLIKNMRNEI